MRRWVVRGAAAALVWGVVVAFALFIDRPAHLAVDAAAVCALLTVWWLCADAYELADAAPWSLYRSPSADRTFDPRFSRLSQELADASNRQAASAALHSSLAAVADRILLDKYDVDRVEDEAAAREVLGEQVSRYLDAVPGNEKIVFSPELDTVLDRLESL